MIILGHNGSGKSTLVKIFSGDILPSSGQVIIDGVDISQIDIQTKSRDIVTLSQKALSHILDLMKSEGISTNTHHLRVGVKGGGCSGLSYTMDFDDSITEMDDVIDLDEIKVVIDKKSVLYLYGTELNYSDGLNGKGFEWVNPNASRTCGCGESFAL